MTKEMLKKENKYNAHYVVLGASKMHTLWNDRVNLESTRYANSYRNIHTRHIKKSFIFLWTFHKSMLNVVTMRKENKTKKMKIEYFVRRYSPQVAVTISQDIQRCVVEALTTRITCILDVWSATVDRLVVN